MEIPRVPTASVGAMDAGEARTPGALVALLRARLGATRRAVFCGRVFILNRALVAP